MLKLCMLRFDSVGGTFKSYAYAFSMVCVPNGDFYRQFYTSHSLDFWDGLRPPRQNYSWCQRMPKCMLSRHSYSRPPKISSFYDIFLSFTDG